VFQLILVCRSVVRSCCLDFTSVASIFLFFHWWSSLHKLSSHNWFSFYLFNLYTWYTLIYSYLMRFSPKITSLCTSSHFSHFHCENLHFPWLDFTLPNWELRNPKAKGKRLASRIAQCAVHDRKNTHCTTIGLILLL